MKTILRILIILAVAAVIGGGTLLLVNNGSTSGLGQGVGDSPLGQHLPGSGETVPGAVPEGFRQGRGPGHGEGLEGGAFSWSESIKNTGIVVVLIIVVALFERLIKAVRTRKAARVAVGAPESGGKEIPIE